MNQKIMIGCLKTGETIDTTLVVSSPHMYEEYEIMTIGGKKCICGLYHRDTNGPLTRDILADIDEQ